MYDIYGTGNKEVTILNIVGRTLHGSPGVFKVALTHASAEESNELEEFVYPDAVTQALRWRLPFPSQCTAMTINRRCSFSRGRKNSASRRRYRILSDITSHEKVSYGRNDAAPTSVKAPALALERL